MPDLIQPMWTDEEAVRNRACRPGGTWRSCMASRRKLARWISAVLTAMLVASQPWSVRAGECTKVVFSAHPEYPPFHWREGDAVVGASIEITRRIFAEMGIAAEAPFVGPWPRVLKAAEHGEIDLVAALKDTPERRQYMEFTSSPFFDNPMAVFVPAGARWMFKGWEDLIGRRGGVNAGDKYGSGFDEFLAEKLTVEPSDTLESNFSKLVAGRIDYFITGLFTGRAYLAAAGLADRIRPMPVPVTSGYIHHGFSTLSPCRPLIDRFNKRLAEMRADGTTAAVVEANIQAWLKRR